MSDNQDGYYSYAVVDPHSGEIIGVQMMPAIFERLPNAMVEAGRHPINGGLKAPKLPQGRWYSLADGSVVPAPELELSLAGAAEKVEDGILCHPDTQPIAGQFALVRAVPDTHWPEPLPLAFKFVLDNGIESWPPRKNHIKLYPLPSEVADAYCAKDTTDDLSDTQAAARYFIVPCPSPGQWNITCIGPAPWHSSKLTIEVAKAPEIPEAPDPEAPDPEAPAKADQRAPVDEDTIWASAARARDEEFE